MCKIWSATSINAPVEFRGNKSLKNYRHLNFTFSKESHWSCNSIHTYKEVSPIAFNRTYIWVDMHRIALWKDIWMQVNPLLQIFSLFDIQEKTIYNKSSLSKTMHTNAYLHPWQINLSSSLAMFNIHSETVYYSRFFSLWWLYRHIRYTIIQIKK